MIDLPDGIWSKARRTHVPGTERMLYRPLRLPANDPNVYERLQHELERLQTLFPVQAGRKAKVQAVSQS
jgi:hypothetical protein